MKLCFFLKQLTLVPPAARLAQSVEHETLNLRVVGSSPTLGVQCFASWQDACVFFHPSLVYAKLVKA